MPNRIRKPNVLKAQRWLWSMGKCGSLSPDLVTYLCTLRMNHAGNHQAQVMSGVDDGKVLAEWSW